MLRRYGEMKDANMLEKIKEDIEIRREKLNCLVLVEDSNESILNLSMEIDNLINMYYIIQL
jgi:hypothetical protein